MMSNASQPSPTGYATLGQKLGRAAAIGFTVAIAAAPVAAPVLPSTVAGSGPLRISGRVGDGLYWSLRAAGASPEVAAQYLAALATQGLQATLPANSCGRGRASNT